MASQGEWSDRSQWVIEAYTSKEIAQKKVEELEAESRAVIAQYETDMNTYDLAYPKYTEDVEKFNNGEIKDYPIEPKYPMYDGDQTYYFLNECELID